jgi:predicted MarR family transcription regulator
VKSLQNFLYFPKLSFSRCRFGKCGVMSEISEANWKIFKQIKERALEKFCLRCLDEFKMIVENDELSPHERYCLHYQTVRDRDKTLANIFDGLSRSSAHIQLMLIRREGLADQDLIAQLSAQFQMQTEPKNFER